MYTIQYTIYNIQYTIYNIQYTIYNIQYTYLDVVKLSDGHIHVYIYKHVRYILEMSQYCSVNHAESKD